MSNLASLSNRFSLPVAYLGDGMYNLYSGANAHPSGDSAAAGAAHAAAGGGAGASAGNANKAIFSQNAKEVGLIIKADEDAALAAARVAQSQENRDDVVDSQVQDGNEGEVRAVELVAAAEEAAEEAAAEAAEAAEAKVEARRPRRNSKSSLKPAEYQQTLLEIAQAKIEAKKQSLQRICDREQRKAEAAAVTAAATEHLPASFESVTATPTTAVRLSRSGTSAHQVPNQYSCARRLAAAARESNDESLRVLFGGISDKSALGQLWPQDENECCYLCGFPTHRAGRFPDGNHTIKILHGNRSPEHVIPMTAGGAAYIGILKAGDNINIPGNENLRNLLRKELRPSHYWCNEVKANMLFITWPNGGQISFNRTVVSNFLYLLYYGSSTGTRFFDEDYCKVYCQQNNKLYPHLVHYFCKTRGITFDNWHTQSITRIEQIINDIRDTIHTVLAPTPPPDSSYTAVRSRFESSASEHWPLRGKSISRTDNVCHELPAGHALGLGQFEHAQLPKNQQRAPAEAEGRGGGGGGGGGGAASAGGGMEEVNNARFSVTIPGLRFGSNFARAAFNHGGHQFAENAIIRGRFTTRNGRAHYNRNRSRSDENRASNKTTPAHREGFRNGYDGRSKNHEQFNKRGDYFIGYGEGKSRKHQENLLESRRRTRKTRKRNRNRKTRKV